MPQNSVKSVASQKQHVNQSRWQAETQTRVKKDGTESLMEEAGT